jgi:capsid protein
MDGERGAEIVQSGDVAVTRSRYAGHSTQTTESVPKVISFDLAPALEAEQESLWGDFAVRPDV